MGAVPHRSDRLTALEAHCRELVPLVRGAGLAIDDDPDAVRSWLDVPVVRLLRDGLVPRRYGVEPYRLGRHEYDLTTCAERVVLWEGVAYGDPNLLLAAPGPLMSGMAVLAVGGRAQQDHYFERVIREPTWTFFGLTEPGKGSAATELETRLEPDGDDFVLRGRKRHVGNGANSGIGVLFCRRAPGPHGIEAVLVDPAAAGYRAEVLPTIGLRGARIADIGLDAVPVPREHVLRGDERRRSGFTGALSTLTAFRPVVAAMALGVARSVVDHVRAERRALPRHQRYAVDDLADRVAVARASTLDVASAVDAGTVAPHDVSAVKVLGSRLAEAATLLATRLLGPACLVDDPWLGKVYRDVRAFELMEGTGHLHRVSVARGVMIALDRRAETGPI